MTSKLVWLLLVTLRLDSIDAQLTCIICNPTTGFACITTTQYVNCDANLVPDFSVVFNCAAAEFCDNNELILTRPCVQTNPVCAIPPFVTAVTTPVTIATTTSSTTTASTTVATATTVNPNTFCKGIKTVGRYPTSTGCKRYIYCYTYMYSGELRGYSGVCQGRTLFDPTLQQCVDGFEACTTLA